MRLFHYGTLLQTPCTIQQLRKPTAGFSLKVYLSIARMQIRHTCLFCFAALFHLKAPAIGALMAWSVDYVMIELNQKRAAIRTLSDGVTELRSRYITSLRREEIGRRLDPPTHWQSWSEIVRHISKNLSRFFLSHYSSPEMFPREERKLGRDSHRLISWRSNDRHVGYSTLQGWLVSFCLHVVWTLTDGCARMCPHWINPIEILKEKDKFELFWLSTLFCLLVFLLWRHFSLWSPILVLSCEKSDYATKIQSCVEQIAFDFTSLPLLLWNLFLLLPIANQKKIKRLWYPLLKLEMSDPPWFFNTDLSDALNLVRTFLIIKYYILLLFLCEFFNGRNEQHKSSRILCNN